MPNAPLAMHTHDHPRVIVALSGGTMKIVNEDGTSEVHQWETGKAYWLSLEEGKRRHADANQGDKPIEVIVVELKNAKRGRADVDNHRHCWLAGQFQQAGTAGITVDGKRMHLFAHLAAHDDSLTLGGNG